MTYTFSPFHISSATSADMKAKGSETLDHARQIVAGGDASAREYASAWYDHHRADHFVKASAAEQALKIQRFAKEALDCARKIAERGEGNYVATATDGSKMLMVATLIPDASAGATGYDPMANLDHPVR